MEKLPGWKQHQYYGPDIESEHICHFGSKNSGQKPIWYILHPSRPYKGFGLLPLDGNMILLCADVVTKSTMTTSHPRRIVTCNCYCNMNFFFYMAANDESKGSRRVKENALRVTKYAKYI